MSRIVVTGAGGYIGIILCRSLVSRGHTVKAIDRYYFGRTPERCEIIKADIRDNLHEHLKDADCVIDLAALSNDATAEIDPALTKSINLNGAEGLAISASHAGVKRYIYSSSASVYGRGYKDGLTETDRIYPLTAYASSKAAIEDVVRKLSFESVILRNATVFGVSPRMRFDLAVNAMTARAWRENEIYIMGGGEQKRPFIHVKDLVSAFLFMVEAPSNVVSGQTFNVGFDEMNHSISQIANMVRNHFRSAKLHMIPDNPDERSYHPSFKKIASVIPNWKPQWTIGRGIQQIIEALDAGEIKIDDPTTITLKWYGELLKWDKMIENLKIDGRLI